MEARRYCAAIVLAVIGPVCSSGLFAASDRTANFIVSAPSRQLATEVARLAELYRRDLAIEWIGQELPRWREPCPISVQVGPHLGAGGATSFMFDQGRPFGWRMSIQGSRERLLDSVLPHEITHTIFATYFGRPLPRWADEGACTSVEHQSETSKQEQMLNQFLRSQPSRGIPFNRMFAMKEYPSDIMPLYSQGFSVVRFLLNHGGKRKFMRYLADGMRYERWDEVTKRHYGFRDLSELQLAWVDWVASGSRDPADHSQIAATTPELTGHEFAAAQASDADHRDRSPYGSMQFDRVAQAARVADERLGIGPGFDRQELLPVRDTRSTDAPVVAFTDQSQARGKSSSPNATEVVARGQNASTEGSWYARQRDKMKGKSIFSIGRSVGDSRVAFSSFASLSGLAKTRSPSTRPQLESRGLSLDSPSLDSPSLDFDSPVPPPPALMNEAKLLGKPLTPTAKPVYFHRQEKPLSTGATVWR